MPQKDFFLVGLRAAPAFVEAGFSDGDDAAVCGKFFEGVPGGGVYVLDGAPRVYADAEPRRAVLA